MIALYADEIPRSGKRRTSSIGLILEESINKSSFGSIDTSGTPSDSTKPGIQCDLRRALSLDYQSRFSKLDISTHGARYSTPVLAPRSPDRKKRDSLENLAHRLHRERTRNISFYDVI